MDQRNYMRLYSYSQGMYFHHKIEHLKWCRRSKLPTNLYLTVSGRFSNLLLPKGEKNSTGDQVALARHENNDVGIGERKMGKAG